MIEHELNKVSDDNISNHIHKREASFALIIARFCNVSLMKLKRISANEISDSNTSLKEIEECLEIFTLAGGCSKYTFPDKPNEYLPTRKENYHPETKI